jgi:GT2 family glycosyltransferase
LEHGDELDSFRKVARRSYETHFSKNVFTQNLLSVMDGLAPAEPEGLSLGKRLTMACPTTENGFSGTVSVVIPAYNAGPTIETLLNRLFGQTGVRKVEVVVVDSGSTDGTPKLCRKHGAKVVKITQNEFTHSYSRNLGAQTACGDILLFMTQDAMPVNENWMSNLIEPIVSGEASAVSCRDLCPEGTDLYFKIAMWSHWGFVGIRDGDRLYHLEQNETAESLRRKASLNDVTTAIDARVFKKFLYRFNYAEDLDMGLRLLKSGYAIKLLASTQSIHGHNRPAGYYLKRSYVEARTLVSIEPQWGVPRQTIKAAARKVTYGAGLLSHALETMLDGQSGQCALDAFMTSLQKHLSDAIKDRLISGYLSGLDDLLDWCIRTMEPFGRESSPDEAELFHHVCWYLDAIVQPYLSAHGIITLDKTAQEAICGCLVKQFCMFIGSTLAGVGPDEPLYETIQILAKGV